jgi:hypothetical protein
MGASLICSLPRCTTTKLRRRRRAIRRSPPNRLRAATRALECALIVELEILAISNLRIGGGSPTEFTLWNLTTEARRRLKDEHQLVGKQGK